MGWAVRPTQEMYRLMVELVEMVLLQVTLVEAVVEDPVRMVLD